MGTLYICHFSESIGNPEKPRATAQHYVGFAEPWHFEARVQQHLDGRGAKITKFVAEQGIGMMFFVIQKGKGATRDAERRIKNNGHFDRLCPVCRARRENPQAFDEPPF